MKKDEKSALFLKTLCLISLIQNNMMEGEELSQAFS